MSLETYIFFLIFRTIRQQLLLISLTIIYFVVFNAALILIVFPICIFRLLVKYVVIFCRPDLGDMVSAGSMMFAVDELTVRPKCTLVTSMTLKGDLQDLEKLRTLVMEKLINRTSSDNTKRFMYPEMRSYLQHWMGFVFWKSENNFNINDHLNIYNSDSDDVAVGKIIDENELKKIEKQLVSKTFGPNLSPWEIVVVRNFVPSDSNSKQIHTVLLLRIHHALADGFSILEIISKVFDTNPNVISPAPLKKKRTMEKIWRTLAFIVQAPYERISQVVECKDPESKWHPKAKDLSEEFSCAISKRISMQDIKEIKKHYGTTFTSVMFALITSSLRELIQQTGENIPKAIHCVAPLPVPGHPKDKLTNYMTGAIVRLPVGLSDSVSRLKYIDEYTNNKRNSTVPTFAFLMIQLVGSLFFPIVKKLVRYNTVTAICSNFAGPEKIEYDGLEMVDAHFLGGLLLGTTGVGFMILSCQGALRIVLRVNKTIIKTDEEAKELLDKATNEIQILKKYI